jgi:hypothetical protein
MNRLPKIEYLSLGHAMRDQHPRRRTFSALLAILPLTFFCSCSSRYSLSDDFNGTTREIAAQYVSGDTATGSIEILEHKVRIVFPPYPLGKLHATDLSDVYSEIVVNQDRFYCIPKQNSLPMAVVYVLTHDGLLIKVDSVFPWHQ